MNEQEEKQKSVVDIATQLGKKTQVVPYLRQCLTCGTKWVKTYVLFPWSKGIPLQKYCSSICRTGREKGRCHNNVS